VKNILFAFVGAALYLGAFVAIAVLYFLMPASRFPVILIVLPAVPMLWLGSKCLELAGFPVNALFRWK